MRAGVGERELVVPDDLARSNSVTASRQQLFERVESRSGRCERRIEPSHHRAQADLANPARFGVLHQLLQRRDHEDHTLGRCVEVQPLRTRRHKAQVDERNPLDATHPVRRTVATKHRSSDALGGRLTQYRCERAPVVRRDDHLADVASCHGPLEVLDHGLVNVIAALSLRPGVESETGCYDRSRELETRLQLVGRDISEHGCGGRHPAPRRTPFQPHADPLEAKQLLGLRMRHDSGAAAEAQVRRIPHQHETLARRPVVTPHPRCFGGSEEKLERGVGRAGSAV